MTASALKYFGYGIPAFALVKILSNFFFARNNTKTVDMESLGVAQAAIENNCSFLVVRAISDTAKQNLPRHTLKSFSLTNSIKISSILLDLVKHPNELPSLLKLAQNSQKAQACLQNVAKLGFGI